jgi:hypothetical protein
MAGQIGHWQSMVAMEPLRTGTEKATTPVYCLDGRLEFLHSRGSWSHPVCQAQ